MDLIQYLKQYLEFIQNQLGQLVTAKEAFNHEQLQRTINELFEHMRLEEHYLYPVLSQAESTKDIIDHLRADHKQIRLYIDRLQEGTPPTVVHDSLKHLLDIFASHVDETDDRLFPRMVEKLTPEQLDQLTEQFKEKTRQLTALGSYRTT